MRYLPLIGSLTILLSVQGSANPKGLQIKDLVRASTCQAQTSDEPVIYGGDFAWNQNLDDIKERANRLYHAGKRLRLRAYLADQEALVVPVEVPSRGIQNVRLTPEFILSVRRHIEEALRLGYVDEIIFSDMGHSHFFVPKEFYDEHLGPLPVTEKDKMYELMLAYPGLKVLYHTAEQLSMLDQNRDLADDRRLQWRFFTRNLVGDNKGQGRLELVHAEEHQYNTAHDYQPGYHYYGAGYYITANRDGCFAYTHEGETKYFDLNLEGMDYTSGGDF